MLNKKEHIKYLEETIYIFSRVDKPNWIIILKLYVKIIQLERSLN